MTTQSKCASVTTLRRCRESVLLMRQQEATHAHLMGIQALSQIELKALLQQVEGMQVLLEGTRKQYQRDVVEAVRALAVLKGRDYDILCMYYVIGLSLREISKRLQCNIRTVTRGKARAMAALGSEALLNRTPQE